MNQLLSKSFNLEAVWHAIHGNDPVSTLSLTMTDVITVRRAAEHFVFSGPTGSHTIAADSDFFRFHAHLAGFIDNNVRALLAKARA